MWKFTGKDIKNSARLVDLNYDWTEHKEIQSFAFSESINVRKNNINSVIISLLNSKIIHDFEYQTERTIFKLLLSVLIGKLYLVYIIFILIRS